MWIISWRKLWILKNLRERRNSGVSPWWTSTSASTSSSPKKWILCVMTSSLLATRGRQVIMPSEVRWADLFKYSTIFAGLGCQQTFSLLHNDFIFFTFYFLCFPSSYILLTNYLEMNHVWTVIVMRIILVSLSLNLESSKKAIKTVVVIFMFFSNKNKPTSTVHTS